MRLLQINDETNEDIAKVVKYANEHKFTIDQMKLLMAGDIEPPGDNPDYMLYINNGYRVVYSLEEQPIGWCHHISISVDKEKKYPHGIATQMIMGAFGMDGNLKNNVSVWMDKNTQSINILQRVK